MAKGYNALGDLIQRTADGQDLDAIWAEFQATLNSLRFAMVPGAVQQLTSASELVLGDVPACKPLGQCLIRLRELAGLEGGGSTPTARTAKGPDDQADQQPPYDDHHHAHEQPPTGAPVPVAVPVTHHHDHVLSVCIRCDRTLRTSVSPRSHATQSRTTPMGRDFRRSRRAPHDRNGAPARGRDRRGELLRFGEQVTQLAHAGQHLIEPELVEAQRILGTSVDLRPGDGRGDVGPLLAAQGVRRDRGLRAGVL